LIILVPVDSKFSESTVCLTGIAMQSIPPCQVKIGIVVVRG
jgi:hypothetical protein